MRTRRHLRLCGGGCGSSRSATSSVLTSSPPPGRSPSEALSSASAKKYLSPPLSHIETPTGALSPSTVSLDGGSAAAFPTAATPARGRSGSLAPVALSPSSSSTLLLPAVERARSSSLVLSQGPITLADKVAALRGHHNVMQV